MTKKTLLKGVKSHWNKGIWKQCRAAIGVWPKPKRCLTRTDHESELCGKHRKVKE